MSAARGGGGEERGAALTEELRAALGDLASAERRLRSREQQRPGTLSYAQVRALARLDDAGEATAGELARAADLTPASVTAMVDHFERGGIVARRRSEADRRIVVVSLTARGRELLAERRAIWHRRWSEALAGVDDADVAAAAAVMRRLARMFDAL